MFHNTTLVVCLDERETEKSKISLDTDTVFKFKRGGQDFFFELKSKGTSDEGGE